MKILSLFKRKPSTDMTFRVSAAALLRSVESSLPFMSVTSSMPVLRMVRLWVDGGVLLVAANNLESSIVCRCANVDADGDVGCVYGAALYKFLKAAGGESDVIVEKHEQCVTFKAGSFTATFPVRPSSEFPTTPSFEPGGSPGDSRELFRALAAATACASRDATRYSINAVRVERADVGCMVVATDGRLLFSTQLPIEVGDVNLPVAFVEALLTSQAALPGTVECLLDDGYFRVSGDFACMSCQVGMDEFPKWKEVIPTEPAIGAFEVDAVTFREALVPFCGAMTSSLTLEALAGVVVLSAVETETEPRLAVNLRVSRLSGEDWTINLDPNLLRLVLGGMDSAGVLEFRGPKSALLIRDPKSVMILMPRAIA